jgi:hypothetical protein
VPAKGIHVFHSPWIYTMNRCAQLSLPLALAGLLAALAPAPAAAQDGQALRRNFPQNALRGGIVFGTPPAILLNGVNTQTAASVRIHGLDNLIMMSGQLVGARAVVDYTIDLQGAIKEIWILSAIERARLWPTTAADAAAWAFDPIAQTWIEP